jgi:hypothetical protein
MRPLAIKTLVWSVVALALLGTLTLYQRPDFLVNLADQLWSCF